MNGIFPFGIGIGVVIGFDIAVLFRFATSTATAIPIPNDFPNSSPNSLDPVRVWCKGGKCAIRLYWMKIFWIAAIVLLLNLPFGYWRASVKRFSPQWIFAIHLPVPMIMALRIYSGLGWRLATFPALIGAFFLGQLLGGRLKKLPPPGA